MIENFINGEYIFVSVPGYRRRRRIGFRPEFTSFNPDGAIGLGIVTMTLDELEAIRLKDLGGLNQEEAAQKMGISQPTLHRVLESARAKVARALVEGKALRIEGGSYELLLDGKYVVPCDDCIRGWKTGFFAPSNAECVNCDGLTELKKVVYDER